jgi:hypothetical protein
MIQINPNSLYSAKDIAELFEVSESAAYKFIEKVPHNIGPGGKRVTGRKLLEWFDEEQVTIINPKLAKKLKGVGL